MERIKEIEAAGYSILPDGVILGLSGKPLKGSITGKGYLKVVLCINGEKWHMKVHRLVAMKFVINTRPVCYNQVNHIDGNKLNNAAINLEWVNNSINQMHKCGTDNYTDDSKESRLARRRAASKKYRDKLRGKHGNCE